MASRYLFLGTDQGTKKQQVLNDWYVKDVAGNFSSHKLEIVLAQLALGGGGVQYWQRDAGSSTMSTVAPTDNVTVGGDLKVGTLTGILKATAGTVGVGATTDDLTEGSSNLYYADTFVDSRVQAADYTIGGTWGFSKVVSGVVPTANAHLATKLYVDEAVEGENIWDRSAGVITPHTAGDSLQMYGAITVGENTTPQGHDIRFWSDRNDSSFLYDAATSSLRVGADTGPWSSMGNYSVAFGTANAVAGTNSTILAGSGNSVSSDFSTIVSGLSNSVSGGSSVVIQGDSVSVVGDFSVALGKTITLDSLADNVFAVGYSDTTKTISQPNSVIFYNDLTTPGSPDLKFGINTLAPTEALDVVGRIALSDSNDSVFIGKDSGGHSSANDSICIGINSGDSIPDNTLLVGNYAMTNSSMSGEDNVGLGHGVASRLGGGEANLLLGNNAGSSLTKGSSNLFAGHNAGYTATDATYNTFVGHSAGYRNTAGGNTFFGASAGYANTTGYRLTIIGRNAGLSHTTGIGSTLVGYNAGRGITSANNNTYIGAYAGYTTNTGINNAFIGYRAGYENTTGSGLAAIGYEAGVGNTTGSNSVYIGYRAGWKNTTAGNNVYIGWQAGQSNITGNYNMYVGTNAGYSATGTGNFMMGYQAGYYVTTPNYNFFLGYYAGRGGSGATGDLNLALGYRSLYAFTAGDRNIAIGAYSAYGLTTGTSNTVIGSYAGQVLGAGSRNVFIGRNAGNQATSSDNTCVGYYCGAAITTGHSNILVGRSAGNNLNAGTYNSCLGYAAGYSLSSGHYNTIMGYQSGYNTGSGDRNTYMGYNAGFNATNANSNTCIGFNSGQKLTGGSGVCIGYQAGLNNTSAGSVHIGYGSGYYNTGTGVTTVGYQACLSGTTATNTTAVGYRAGYSATTAGGCVYLGFQAGYSNTTANRLFINNSSSSSPLIWGDFSNQILSTPGDLGIGTQSPDAKLHIYDGNSSVTPYTNTKVFIEDNGTCYTQYGVNSTGEGGFIVGVSGDNDVGYFTWNNNTSCAYIKLTALSGTNYLRYDSSTTRVGYLSSSARYKKDIVDLDSKYDWSTLRENYLSLNVRSFKYKDGDTPDIGFIAEEVYEIMPELTVPEYKSDPTDKGPVKKQVLTGRVEAITNHIMPFLNQKVLTEHEQKIKDQQAQIESLEARISQLESLITK